ncbi:MAG: hypothetical protein KDK63_04160 [Chlamydiia bacterium]|nr:hypothetical protein [Chlamydiia bacterium]
MKTFLFLFFSLALTPLFAEMHTQMKETKPIEYVTRPAHTCSKLYGFFVTGEFIYWKSRQEDLFTVTRFENVQTATARNVVIHAKDAQFKFSPGFKVGLGGNLPFDGWNLYLNWTHFHNNPITTFRSATPQMISADRLGSGEGLPFVAGFAKVDYNLMLNVLDFTAGRRFFLSNTWIIQPSLGLKTAWIHQTFRFNYDNVQSVPVPNLGVIPGLPEHSVAKNNFWGIGPTFACEGKWVFGWGLGLLGKISGALLWGEFDQTSRSVNTEFTDGDVIPVTSSLKNKTHRVRPTCQMFLGLDWEWCFIPNRLSMQLRLGYETHYYPEQILSTISVEASDLTLEGLTFMGRLDF